MLAPAGSLGLAVAATSVRIIGYCVLVGAATAVTVDLADDELLLTFVVRIASGYCCAPARVTVDTAVRSGFGASAGRRETVWATASWDEPAGQSLLNGGSPKLVLKLQPPCEVDVTWKLSGSLGLAATGVASSGETIASTSTAIRIRWTFMETSMRFWFQRDRLGASGWPAPNRSCCMAPGLLPVRRH